MIDMHMLGIAFTVVMISLMASRKKRTHNTTTTRRVEVEVTDELMKEKVSNLYEEQEVYNLQISNLTHRNELLYSEIRRLDEDMKKNLADMEMAISIQPDCNIDLLRSNYDASNEYILKRKTRIEGDILSNQEKIIKYKNKSNEISSKIEKIGQEIYRQQ